jgi:hypothetical protein
MPQQQLTQGKKVISGIMKEHFSQKEIKDFQANGITMEIKKLPPDIAGQSEGTKIYFDPETISRSDAVTEDVVVHELIHAYNRFREQRNPAVYTRRESTLEGRADVQKDIEIEEAVTEAITASRLAKFDETGKEVAVQRGALNKRYNSQMGRLALATELNERTHIPKEGERAAWRERARLEREKDPYAFSAEFKRLMEEERAASVAARHAEGKKEQIFTKGMEKAGKEAQKKAGRRLTISEKEKILTDQWAEVYGERPVDSILLSDIQRHSSVIANDPARLSLKRYPYEDLNPHLPLDPSSGAQSNRRFKVGGEVKNFPLAAIGYDKENLETYAEQLRLDGFYVRSVGVKYDGTSAAKRWALFVHPKYRETSADYVNNLEKLYREDPMNPQFGAYVREALVTAWNYNSAAAVDRLRMRREGGPVGDSIVLHTLTPRWTNNFGEGPVASNVRLFNKKQEKTDNTGNESTAMSNFQHAYNRYVLHAVPVDRANIVGPMNDSESVSGQGIDERAGEVYGLQDAYLLMNESGIAGEPETVDIGVYSSVAEARAAIPLVYDGTMSIHTLPGADVLDFYRRWPYYFRRGNQQWLKTGIEGNQIKFESIGFLKGNQDNTLSRNWLQESGDTTQSLQRTPQGFETISNQLYARKISGKTFRGVRTTLSKAQARMAAARARTIGFNARVIPNAKGHRVYLRRKDG